MEKRALIAFVLSMAIFALWSVVFSPKKETPPPGQTTTEQTETQTETTAKTETTSPPEPAAPVETTQPAETESAPVQTEGPNRVSVAQADTVTVETDLYTAVFTQSGGRLKSLTLNKYRTAQDANSPPKELVVTADPNDLPLGLSFKYNKGPDLRNAIFEADKSAIKLNQEGQQDTLEMVHRSPNGLTVYRTYTFTAGSYLFDMTVRLENRAQDTLTDSLVIGLKSEPLTKKLRYAGFGAVIDGKLKEIKPNDVEDDLAELKDKSNYELAWAAYMDQYFMAAVLPKEQTQTRVQAKPYNDNGVAINFVQPTLEMPPDTQKTYNYIVYYGPKDYMLLKSMGNQLAKAIDFGWFDILSKPLLWFMTWMHQYVGNYGVVIIIVTLLIKILFWPLTAKSYKSMKGMQKLQPKIMKMREKYKDDREAMNREMMQLYKAYKVNPLGGCLPMVIQIPVFIALYRLLDYSLELRHAPFMLWIKDLAAPDRLFHFGFNIPLMDPPSGIPVLTLLMGASMLLQQKMTPTPGDPMQAKIMMFMPLFFTFIFINFPAGLVLYWLTNNILSIGQQTYINKSTD
jgi:YidC/Oxa1 family membrane protein insertase